MPDMRDEFEAVYPLPEGMERNGESYTGGEMWWLWEERWQVWQRSRATLRVVLPDDGIEDCRRDWQNSCRDNFDTGYCYATDRITQALQQAGIEVKP
ncbi:hypothetical protein RJ634_005979 [Pseudomonas aeruginosa]|nr:hypothetical protein [Pseudomonas aeruginosa]